MKKLTLIGLFLSVFSCGQHADSDVLKESTTAYSFREVDQMAVFEGCQPSLSSEELKNCFSSKMNTIFGQKMNEVLNSQKLPIGVVIIKYTIGSEGKLKDISGQGNEVILPVALSIFEEINQTISYQPALKNGIVVDVKYSMPVRIQN